MSEPTNQEKYEAKVNYARNRKAPLFAPIDGCYSCNRKIWNTISLEKANSELITGCPYCNRSYCD